MNTPAAASHASTSTAIRLRQASPDDAPALATLLANIGWFPAFLEGETHDHAAALHPLLCPSEQGLHLIAEDAQGQLLGYCALHWLPIAFLQGYEAYLSELFVAPEARDSGTGSCLLHSAVAAARKRGCARIWLINNRERDSYLRGFYEKHGWIEQAQMARFVLPLSD